VFGDGHGVASAVAVANRAPARTALNKPEPAAAKHKRLPLPGKSAHNGHKSAERKAPEPKAAGQKPAGGSKNLKAEEVIPFDDDFKDF
jgi:hypothetical protein